MRCKPKVIVIALTLTALVSGSQPNHGRPPARQFAAVGKKAWAAPLQNYDIRLGVAASVRGRPTAAQRAAAERFQRQIGQPVEIRFDPWMGGVRHLFSLTTFLSRPSSEPPASIARRFLSENADLFGLDTEAIDRLRLVRNYLTEHNGVRHLAFQQVKDGIEVFQSDLRVHLMPDGQIISVSGHYDPDVEAELEPRLAPEDAVRRAVMESFPDVPFVPLIKTRELTPARRTVFHRGDFADDVTVQLTIFPDPVRDRLGWRIRLHLPERDAWYDLILDAHTGELLYRFNLYVFEQEPRGLIFAINPDVGPQMLVAFRGDPQASPAGWLAPPPNVRLVGNNAIVLPSPLSNDLQFAFPFRNLYELRGAKTFDLDRKTLRFAPNGNGYDFAQVPFSFDTDLGTNITANLSNRDEGSAFLSLPFSFPFFGRTYTALSINANGNVTFLGPSSSSVESVEGLAFGLPRIAALWDDLDFGQMGSLHLKLVSSNPPKAIITWNAVPEFSTTNSNTVQLTLTADGTIEISFNGVTATDGLVGLSPGLGNSPVRHVDFSETPSLKGSDESFFEQFPMVEVEPAATNLFYHLNFAHDYFYRLGFDEAAGNFQMDNFGRGGLGGDPVIGYAQATGFDNANFSITEDGIPPRTRYFLWTIRRVDSDFDADVIYHEYAHGLTTRLVGGPHLVASLNTLQGGSMGEGWSDAYSASLTDDPITGEYSTGNRATGVRTVAYHRSPLTYGDFANRYSSQRTISARGGSVGIGRVFWTEVHRDGEIWATVLWDLRTALGRQTYEQLITDALKLTPPFPSMLEARDAILLADRVNNRGANLETIWRVFAARGMGFSARSFDGNDTLIFEAFDMPSDPLPPVKQVLFTDDMESATGGWTVLPETALWHRSSRRSASGSTSWYYGQEATGTYDTGAANFGALISPPIALPSLSGTSALVLEFDHFLRRNTALGLPFDCGFVRIVDTTTGTVKQKGIAANNTPTVPPFTEASFEHREINISEFAGRTIQVQFYFDTIDRFSNTAEGWYIDNVRITLRAR
ncbi:MAG TPA: M36 family metallopeptidase [Blastocatellia bacterium]|nr:M36 family metallopeptidase [Blastocatellia bacterium]